MGVMKKIFGVQETETHEDAILKELKGREEQIIRIEEGILKNLDGFHSRLNQAIRVFRSKREVGKRVPEGLISRLHSLEQGMRFRIEKIKHEVDAEVVDAKSVNALMSEFEAALHRM